MTDKTYLLQMELIPGNDEFWESDPSPREVLELINQELGEAYLNLRCFKIVQVTDETEYSL